MELNGLTEAELARRLGESRQNVNHWRSGRMPEPHRQGPLLEKMGGDIRRALPGYQPPEGQRPLTVMGTVQAGSSSTNLQHSEEHADLDFLWRKSSGWAYSTGPVRYLRVVGDSMEPAYPANSIIAVRAHNGMPLPHSMPVVLLDRTTQSSMVKLYQKKLRGTRAVVFGVPINPLHEVMSWHSEDDVKIQFVVLGKAEPLSGREIRQGTYTMRDSSPEPE